MKIIFEKKKKGLWANIHAKRERGESPAKPGEEDYPDKKQWDKLTKEELEQVVSEELHSILEQEKADLDPKKQAEEKAKDAQRLANAAKQQTRAQVEINKVRPPEERSSSTADLKSKLEQEKEAKELARKTKELASEVPVTEQKSNFQKEMERKGKGWKVRLLTKGKQPTGSAYPNKAPVERAKSAPPGAGGV